MTNPNDRQVGGDHYQTGYQPWDLFEDYGIGYMECNVIKYVARWRKKFGLQDLEKAFHYLDKLIDLHLNRGRMAKAHVSNRVLSAFCCANGLENYEVSVIECMAQWSSSAELARAKASLAYLIEEAQRMEGDNDHGC